MNPLERAIKSAVKANDLVGDFIARVGTSSHPRGYVTTAYRNAERAMITALREENRLAAANDVMLGLRRTLEAETRTMIADAQMAGMEESARQLAFYGIASIPSDALRDKVLENDIEAAVLARFDAQRATIQALLMTGAPEEQIVGSDERSGALRASDVVLAASAWAATAIWESFSSWTTQPRQGAPEFKKQAIAALDNRTTDCCLRVHGQVQPFDGMFDLTGTPRYADKLEWAPFHGYCRTAIALYLPEFDDGLTERMRAGADQVLAERANGQFIDRHPADAYGD